MLPQLRVFGTCTTLDKKNDAVPIKLSMHQQKAQRLMAEREEKKFWNKQNEVDRFATDTRTRKIIQEVTMPILDNQLSLQNKIEFDIMKRLEDHHDRLEAVEYALYKTENPDSRFEKIYASLAEYEVNRRMDKQSFEDLQRNIEQQLKDSVFDMDCKIRELDHYKTSFENLSTDISTTKERIESFMNQQADNLTKYMQQGSEKMSKMEDRILKLEDKSLDQKFQIDKLMSLTTGHSSQLHKNKKLIDKIQMDVKELSESKQDMKEYQQQRHSLMKQLAASREVAMNAALSAERMTEFVYKFEPIYIQRTVTQALSYVFPDSTVQWRLNWFNEVKMPILTTILLHRAEISLEENMEKFKAMIQLNSLTQDELYIKNAMKSQEMHQAAVEIITETMNKLITDDANVQIREVNLDIFLQRLNQELMNRDPATAISLGLKCDKKEPGTSAMQTPEELAAQEAERERML